jgi:membrane peptidoglycan carboxypeptidase
MSTDARDQSNSRLSQPSWFGYAMAIMVLKITLLSVSITRLLAGTHFPELAAITSPRVIVLTFAEGHVLPHAGELRLAPVAAEDMPANVTNAVLSIEDRRFFHHGALDFFSVLRALRQNIEAGKIVAGGSTITQQLAKTGLTIP